MGYEELKIYCNTSPGDYFRLIVDEDGQFDLTARESHKTVQITLTTETMRALVLGAGKMLLENADV